VVITDPRLLTKSYGRGLLSILPPARRVFGRWELCKREIERFFAEDA
jgi:hypothetical protein